MSKNTDRIAIYFGDTRLLAAIFKGYGLIISEDENANTKEEFIHKISNHPKFTESFLLMKALEVGMLIGDEGLKLKNEVENLSKNMILFI